MILLENRARKFYIQVNSPFLPIGVLKYEHFINKNSGNKKKGEQQ
jgi:hypothetical protein